MSDTEGQAQVLVVYHFYESLTTCEEDEEIQVIRSNLLTFLRCVCSSIRTLSSASLMLHMLACQDQIWYVALLQPPHSHICVQDQALAQVMHSNQLTIQLCLSFVFQDCERAVRARDSFACLLCDRLPGVVVFQCQCETLALSSLLPCQDVQMRWVPVSCMQSALHVLVHADSDIDTLRPLP